MRLERGPQRSYNGVRHVIAALEPEPAVKMGTFRKIPQAYVPPRLFDPSIKLARQAKWMNALSAAWEVYLKKPERFRTASTQTEGREDGLQGMLLLQGALETLRAQHVSVDSLVARVNDTMRVQMTML